MKIVEYESNEDVILIKYDPDYDSINLDGIDSNKSLTPLQAQQLADALQRTCRKTQYFQGLKEKCF